MMGAREYIEAAKIIRMGNDKDYCPDPLEVEQTQSTFEAGGGVAGWDLLIWIAAISTGREPVGLLNLLRDAGIVVEGREETDGVTDRVFHLSKPVNEVAELVVQADALWRLGKDD